MTDTETQNLPALLREIAELAPEVVYASEEVRQWSEFDLQVKLGDTWHPVPFGEPEVGAQSLAIIQAALQAAIEARGWEWSLNDSGATARIGSSYLMDDTIGTGTADDPATALCIAFLKALESEA